MLVMVVKAAVAYTEIRVLWHVREYIRTGLTATGKWRAHRLSLRCVSLIYNSPPCGCDPAAPRLFCVFGIFSFQFPRAQIPSRTCQAACWNKVSLRARRQLAKKPTCKFSISSRALWTVRSRPEGYPSVWSQCIILLVQNQMAPAAKLSRRQQW